MSLLVNQVRGPKPSPRYCTARGARSVVDAYGMHTHEHVHAQDGIQITTVVCVRLKDFELTLPELIVGNYKTRVAGALMAHIDSSDGACAWLSFETPPRSNEVCRKIATCTLPNDFGQFGVSCHYAIGVDDDPILRRGMS